MGKYYLLVSLIPPLPAALGEKLPLPFAEISRLIRRHIEPDDSPIIESQLAAVDVANFENLHQGRPVFMEGGLCSRDEIEGKRNLPLFIRHFLEAQDQGIRRPYLFDALWERYFAYVYSLAQEKECRFLIEYTAWEIGLRNHWVALRARERGMEGEDYFVLPQIGVHDLSGLVTLIKSQKNPLMAERLIDEERLKAIFHSEGGDPFSIDAVLALLSRARVLGRWERVNTPYELHRITERR